MPEKSQWQAGLAWLGFLSDPVYGHIQLPRIPPASSSKKSKLRRRKKCHQHTIKGEQSNKKFNNCQEKKVGETSLLKLRLTNLDSIPCNILETPDSILAMFSHGERKIHIYRDPINEIIYGVKKTHRNEDVEGSNNDPQASKGRRSRVQPTTHYIHCDRHRFPGNSNSPKTCQMPRVHVTKHLSNASLSIYLHPRPDHLSPQCSQAIKGKLVHPTNPCLDLLFSLNFNRHLT